MSTQSWKLTAGYARSHGQQAAIYDVRVLHEDGKLEDKRVWSEKQWVAYGQKDSVEAPLEAAYIPEKHRAEFWAAYGREAAKRVPHEETPAEMKERFAATTKNPIGGDHASVAQQATLAFVASAAEKAGYSYEIREPRDRREGAGIVIRGPRGAENSYGVTQRGTLVHVGMSQSYDRDFTKFTKRMEAQAKKLVPKNPVSPGTREWVERLLQRTRSYQARVKAEVERHGVYVGKQRDGGMVTITRSTRPGVAYQVTLWTPEEEPTGHIDAPDLDAAARAASSYDTLRVAMAPDVERNPTLRELRSERREARAKIQHVKAAEKEAREEIRSRCGAERGALAKQAKRLENWRKRVIEKEKTLAFECAAEEYGSKVRERETVAAARGKAARSLQEERSKSVRAGKRGKRRTSAEAREEAEHGVEADLPASLVPVWNRVKSRIKGGPRKSRTEAFLEWVEEHPDEAVEIQQENADADVERWVRDYEAQGYAKANPLEPGSSRAAVSRNIHREMKAGKPRAQAVAIALENARRTVGKQRAARNPSDNDKRAAELYGTLTANREAYYQNKYAYDRFALIQQKTWEQIQAEPAAVKEHVWLLVEAEDKARKMNAAERASWVRKNPAVCTPCNIKRSVGESLRMFDAKQVKRGLAEETREHGKKLAPRVVLDHLALDPNYYSRTKAPSKLTARETITVERKVKVNPAAVIRRVSDDTRGTLAEWIRDNSGDADDPDFRKFIRALAKRGPGARATYYGGAGGDDEFVVERRTAEKNPTTYENIVEYIRGKGFTYDEAVAIREEYIKHKAIKIDSVGGGWTFAHGAFGDQEPMRRALEQHRKMRAKLRRERYELRVGVKGNHVVLMDTGTILRDATDIDKRDYAARDKTLYQDGYLQSISAETLERHSPALLKRLRKEARNPKRAAKNPPSRNPTVASPKPTPNGAGLEERGYVWQLDVRKPDDVEKIEELRLGNWQWMLCHDPRGRVWPRNEALIVKDVLTDAHPVNRASKALRDYAGDVPIFEDEIKVPSGADWKLVGVVDRIWYERTGELEKPYQHEFGENGETLPNLYTCVVDRRRFYRIDLGKGSVWNHRGFVSP